MLIHFSVVKKSLRDQPLYNNRFSAPCQSAWRDSTVFCSARTGKRPLRHNRRPFRHSRLYRLSASLKINRPSGFSATLTFLPEACFISSIHDGGIKL
jgi:hypothetical protein